MSGRYEHGVSFLGPKMQTGDDNQMVFFDRPNNPCGHSARPEGANTLFCNFYRERTNTAGCGHCHPDFLRQCNYRNELMHGL